MGKEARIKNTVKAYLVAGESMTLKPGDFDLYNGGVADTVARVGDETLSFESALTSYYPISISANNAVQCVVSAFKHTRSTSTADDAAGANANTYVQDLSDPVIVRFTGNLVHPTAGSYYFDFDIVYYAAINTPNISISRLSAVLGSGSNTTSGNSTAAQINAYSPYKPDKAVPHRLGEFIGYAHKMEGNVKVKPNMPLTVTVNEAASLDYKVTLYKLAVIDKDISKVSAKLDGFSTGYINMSSINRYGGYITIVNSNSSTADVTKNISLIGYVNDVQVSAFTVTLIYKGKSISSFTISSASYMQSTITATCNATSSFAQNLYLTYKADIHDFDTNAYKRTYDSYLNIPTNYPWSLVAGSNAKTFSSMPTDCNTSIERIRKIYIQIRSASGAVLMEAIKP